LGAFYFFSKGGLKDTTIWRVYLSLGGGFYLRKNSEEEGGLPSLHEEIFLFRSKEPRFPYISSRERVWGEMSSNQTTLQRGAWRRRKFGRGGIFATECRDRRTGSKKHEPRINCSEKGSFLRGEGRSTWCFRKDVTSENREASFITRGEKKGLIDHRNKKLNKEKTRPFLKGDGLGVERRR